MEIKPYTFMVFVACDNSLDQAGYQNILDMERVGSSETLNVVVQYDRAPQSIHTDKRWEGTRRYFIQKSADTERITSPVLADMGKIDSGDPQTLIDFAAWAMSTYPAKNYVLVISSHGTGWEDWPGYRSAPAKHRSVFRHTKLIGTDTSVSISEVGAAVLTRAIAIDESAQDFLDNKELSKVLKTIRGMAEGQKATFILSGFDACLMSTIEVLYENREGGCFFVGSEDTEPGHGWPYDRILPRFLVNQSPDVLARGIVDDYIQYYTANGGTECTASQVALSPVDVGGLVQAVNSLGCALLNSLDKSLYMTLLLILKIYVKRLYIKEYLDLGSFAHEVQKQVNVPLVQKAATAVLEQLPKVVLREQHLSNKLSNVHGLSIYFPLLGLGEGYNTVYKTLDFYRDCSNWGCLLEAFHSFIPE